MFIRARSPNADPYLFPLVALLSGFGLVMIYRIDEVLARQQAGWFVVGIVLFVATVVWLRDVRVLERYRYVIAAAGIGLLLLPRVPGIGAQVNGAYLSVDIGPLALSADRVRKALHRRLPGQLPHRARRHARGRRPPGAGRHDSAAEALRAAARGVGGGDGDARLHPRPRQLADVLRGVPGAAVRRHGACSPS